jgi:hypothetical protein
VNIRPASVSVRARANLPCASAGGLDYRAWTTVEHNGARIALPRTDGSLPGGCAPRHRAPWRRGHAT